MPKELLGQNTGSRKSLTPKPPFQHSDQLPLRLAMLDNGWPPIPCESKSGVEKEWTKWVIDRERVENWDRTSGKLGGSWKRGTGVRLAGDMLVVDLDIKDAVVMGAVLDAIEDAFPDWVHGALWRNSGAISLALFGRVSETQVKSLHSRTYTDKAHIEIHTGNASRYFAVSGPHKEPGRFYQFDGPTPWDTRLDSLPVFPAERIFELIDIVEAVLGQYLEVLDDERVSGDGEDIFDLTPEMRFEIKNGDVVTLGELEDMLEIGPSAGVHGVMEFDWGKSDSQTRHKAFRRERGDNAGRLMVTDFYRDEKHYWAEEEPPPPIELDEYSIAVLKALMEKAAPTQAADASAPDEIDHSGTAQEVHDSALGWCARNLAWYPQAFNGRGGVVSIHPDGPYQKPITLVALRSTMARCVYEAVGPRGGSRKHNPVDSWMAQTSRVEVAGVRMRPELACPLFREDGQLFVNRYVVPRHPPGGTIEPFVRNLERLVPDAVERAWVWNWFACLVQHPEWRMIALVMLAREMRSGRGLLAETLQLVLGEQFVVGIPYALVSGGAKFNAEVETRLLAYVNEAKAIDGGKYHPREAAKEALKVFVEPNHRIPFRVEPKGVDPYFTRAAVSTLILTNHINGIPIDEGDGRFAIVRNGGRMSGEDRDAYQQWMACPENIGALWRALAAHVIEQDRSVFDPYMAPEFDARDLMIESGKTAIDRAWEAAVAKIATAADLYTMSQVVKVARAMVMSRSPGADFDEMIERHTVNNGYRIGTRNGTNWLVTYRGERERVYALNDEGERRYTAALRQVILKQLDAAQRVADAPTKLFNKLLRGVEGVENEE